jgi:F-type H+-transporting ATPase subunit b
MKLRSFAAPLTFASLLLLSGASLRAQTHTPAAQTESSAPTPAQVPAEAAESSAHGEQVGAHHGPAVKLFGIPLGQIGQFAVRVANFGIFFAILYFILKGALSSAFKDRAKELEEQLSQAEKDKAEGEAQLKELEIKMAGMQKELEGIMAKSDADAQFEKQRVLEAARLESDQILAQTLTEIEFQKRLAEKELRALVAELAIEGATRRLEARVRGDIAEQVIDRAIQEVGGAK